MIDSAFARPSSNRLMFKMGLFNSLCISEAACLRGCSLRSITANRSRIVLPSRFSSLSACAADSYSPCTTDSSLSRCLTEF